MVGTSGTLTLKAFALFIDGMTVDKQTKVFSLGRVITGGRGPGGTGRAAFLTRQSGTPFCRREPTTEA